MSATNHRSRTLALATMLHAFTHIYQMALTPLFLLIQQGFRRETIGDATLLLTLMLVAYFLPSYAMGILADRFSRKKLLSIGLAINALGFVGLALAPTYSLAVVSVIVAGVGGSFFHPAATAMVAQLYPGKAGRALGLLGIGASIGFFVGPFYAGWRAKMAHDWRAPVLELGIAGLVAAALFFWLVEEHRESVSDAHPARPKEPMFPSGMLWLMFLLAAAFFFLRDFTGSSMSTVGSLFLQKVRAFDVDRTGLTISFIFLASAISNPLFGHLSDQHRMKWAAVLTVISAGFVAAFPFVPNGWIIPALLGYGFFFMATYPIVEAALMESVPNAVRGRVFGLFITIGGLLGNLSHWIDGRWVESFGARIHEHGPYYKLYSTLAVLLLGSLIGLPCLRAIRRREAALAKHPH